MPLLPSVRPLRAPALLLAVVALGSCGGDATSPGRGPAREVPVASVVVTPLAPSVELGDTTSLTVVLRDFQGQRLTGRTVAWSSADPGTATVADGVVRGVRLGTTELTARSGDVAATVAVTVAPARVVVVELMRERLEARVHEIVPLSITLYDRHRRPVLGRVPRVTIADTRVAQYSAEGLRALNPGQTAVAVSVDDAAAFLHLSVAAEPPPPGLPMQRALLLEVGARGWLTSTARGGTGYPPLTAPQAVATSDPAVVEVSGWGYQAIAPGEAEITLRHEGVETRIPVTVAGAAPPSEFDVDVRWASVPHPGVAASVAKAVAHWRRVVLGDLPPVHLDLPEGACVDGAPAVDELVDDLLVWIRVVPIDGPGGVLGEAGPCVVRPEGGLPVAGIVLIDEADTSPMPFGEMTRDRLVLHELGHVLGVGTLWEEREQLVRALPSDPRHVGPRTQLAAGDLGFVEDGVLGAAVENGGGPGTADSHWRESVFRDELMTGWLDAMPGEMLTRLTIASLADLGYVVHEAAGEPFVWRGPVVASRALPAPAAARVPLRDRTHRPRFVAGPDGSVRRITP